jgi:DNA-binding transcriptional ArsR family regulator
MSTMRVRDELLKAAALLRHPLRFRIVELLLQEPMSARELVEALGENRRLVSYHLLTLEEQGFVSATFELPDEAATRERSAKRYCVTGKGQISLRVLFLEEQGFQGDESGEVRPALKERVMRIYQATEKAEGALNALKDEKNHSL